MTEAEWLTATRPLAMLGFLVDERQRGRHPDHAFLLFACAGMRRVWDRLRKREFREAVEVAERFALGQTDRRRLDRARKAAEEACQQAYLEAYGYAEDPSLQCAFIARDLAGPSGSAAAWSFCQGLVAAMKLLPSSEAADLLREVFGNPFRSPRLPEHWRVWNEGTIARLARHVREEGRFDEMPVLGDALEEAGCVDDQILAHCRSTAPHVAGCWVLRLLLAED